MNMAFKVKFILLLIVSVFVSGCYSSTNGTAYSSPQGVQPMGTGGDASGNATISAMAYQMTIDAQVARNAEATRVAAQATSDHEQRIISMTAEAGATGTVAAGTATAVYQTTSDALSFQATGIAINATGTAVSMIANAEATLVSAAATKQYQDYVAYQRKIEREDKLALSVPYFIGFLIFSLAMISLAYLWYRDRERVRLSTPRTVYQDNRQITLVPDPKGGYNVLPGTTLKTPQLTARTMTRGDEPVEGEVIEDRQVVPLPKLDKYHILLVGETNAGKSTAMRAIIGYRQNVVVLDPHAAPEDWPNARVIGAGRDFEAIDDFMGQMQNELNRRAILRARGQREFIPMTVMTDEMPAIASNLGKAAMGIWRMWLREGRKFGLYMVTSTQSTRVKTLGIDGESDVLKNFAAILYLGEVAMNQYPDLVVGQDRPAVLRTKTMAQPVIVPNMPSGGVVNGEASGHQQPLPYPFLRDQDVQDMVNNVPLFSAPLPKREPLEQVNARRLDRVINDMNTLTAVTQYLVGRDGRVSGQEIDTITKPALRWRVEMANCERSKMLLDRGEG